MCATHGGRAPQVRKSAHERLLEAADPAAARLVRALQSSDERVALAAARAILDRSGHGAASSVAMSGPDGKPIEYQDATPIAIDSLSPDARRQILEILERERLVRVGGGQSRDGT